MYKTTTVRFVTLYGMVLFSTSLIVALRVTLTVVSNDVLNAINPSISVTNGIFCKLTPARVTFSTSVTLIMTLVFVMLEFLMLVPLMRELFTVELVTFDPITVLFSMRESVMLLPASTVLLTIVDGSTKDRVTNDLVKLDDIIVELYTVVLVMTLLCTVEFDTKVSWPPLVTRESITVLFVTFALTRVVLSTRLELTVDEEEIFDFTMLELSTVALVMLLCVTDDPSITFDALIVESLMYDSMTDAFVSCGTLVMLLLSTVMLLIPVVKLMLEWLMLSGPVPLSVMFSKSVQKTLLSRSSVPVVQR